MPPPELAYKPEYKFNIGVSSIAKSSTKDVDEAPKPKKTLRKFGLGTKNRAILTKNVTIAFPDNDIEEEKW